MHKKDLLDESCVTRSVPSHLDLHAKRSARARLHQWASTRQRPPLRPAQLDSLLSVSLSGEPSYKLCKQVAVKK